MAENTETLPTPTQKKSTAGPPPYTITCEQPPVSVHPASTTSDHPSPPPTYAEAVPGIGWNVPKDQRPIVTQQPSSVLYVTRSAPTVIVNHGGLLTGNLMSCPYCRTIVSTRVSYRPGCQTHTYACLFCLFGCWICCPLPYCTPSCQDEIHYCANCGKHIGTIA